MVSNHPHPVDGAASERAEPAFGAALDHLLNATSDSFAVLDRDGRVVRANIAFRRLTGPAGGAHDASILSYVEPGQRDAVRAALLSLGDKSPSHLLSLQMRIGRETRQVEADIAWLSETRMISFVGRDVTRHDLLERERLETQAIRQAVEQVGSIGHWRVSAALRLEYSAGAAHILGLDPAAPPLVLAELVEMVDPADRQRAVTLAREGYEKRQPVNGTVRINRPDGSWRMVQFAGDASVNPRGEIEAVHGVLVDKTDSHAALHAAMNADTTVRRFVQAAPMAVAMYDRDMRVLMCSRGYLDDVGLPEEHVLGRTMFDVMPWMPERWRAAMRQVMRGEPMRSDRERLDLPNGAPGWIKWAASPWRDASGEIGGIVIVHENVTDLMTAQHQVETSRERMTFGMSMTATLIVEFDFESRQVNLEGDWKQLFPQEPTFDSFSGIEPWIHPADRDVLAHKWRTHLNGGPPYTIEYRVTFPDGREAWQSASIRILKSVKGQPARAFAVVNDISARKAIESKAQAAEQRALMAGAAKSDFLSNMSHEIRTPLNGVLAVSEVLARTSLDERQAEMVRLIATSGRTLLRVMDDLVEFSRLEGDEIEFDVRPFDLEEKLRQTCEAARVRAEAKGLKFDCFISATVDGVFRGDPHRIEQVLGNLLNNAVKFTEAGSIDVSAEVIDSHEHETTLKIVVTDTGVGFAPELAERIFERFEQADASDSRKFGGLGLGLSIVKRLVERMNGTVKAASTKGVGSTFEVQLPMSRDRIAALGALATVAVEDFDAETAIENLRLLVAEDNPMNRRVVELLLANSGMQITFAENGREALETFKSRAFDLVLMDLQMPIMGGLAATRAIRDWERAQGRIPTPILAVSANATAVHVEEARQSGADDHVAKPIVRETLFEAIARYARPRIHMAAKDAEETEFDLDQFDVAV